MIMKFMIMFYIIMKFMIMFYMIMKFMLMFYMIIRMSTAAGILAIEPMALPPPVRLTTISVPPQREYCTIVVIASPCFGRREGTRKT